jgi:hypothetical protein
VPGQVRRDHAARQERLLELAALVEPLAVGLEHARAGDVPLVIGGGAIGLGVLTRQAVPRDPGASRGAIPGPVAITRHVALARTRSGSLSSPGPAPRRREVVQPRMA